jgi:ribonuclease inhibitor
MNRIELDVRNIFTVRALHIYLAYRFDLPAHYGKNLDALYDVLTEESRMAVIRIMGTKEAQGELTAYMPKLLRVFEDAARENERISVEIA